MAPRKGIVNMDGDQPMPATRAAEEGTPLTDLRALTIAERKRQMEENLPTHLDEKMGGRYCIVSGDRLSAEYIGWGQHGYDVGAVQANRPVPPQRLLYYFEMTVEDRGRRGAIGIGFSDENFDTHHQPGWDPNSYGYHGDNGRVYRERGWGDPFGPTFSTGDTVGAGINYAAQEILFTKNGRLVGRTPFNDTEEPLYPTIGLHSYNEKVVLNFGQRPFVFDVVVQEDWERRQRALESAPLPLL